ncbi:uncharacterized protein LOC130648636 [Hydractinia symbiolongicarpus]|uniref:uncharacterized protein LOC130648636 n=1 Tax=Hydractinia symbiolongicarpus TaxID=13093 RepID=UPI00254A4354|nr:uncharacterized protein LOC130648636 [Hydractinia symbiolongicarpus]
MSWLDVFVETWLLLFRLNTRAYIYVCIRARPYTSVVRLQVSLGLAHLCTYIITASFLCTIFQACLKKSFIPVQWRIASEVYKPKNNTPCPSNIKDFRPIALLNVKGKLFFSLISKRLESHIIKKNNFINTSIQKVCMEEVPVCWEHMSIVWSTRKNAKAQHSSPSATWLDIANAYPSVPHKLIFMSLKRYGVPESWIRLIQLYYDSLWSKSFSASAPSSWHQHCRGVLSAVHFPLYYFLQL